MAENPAKSPRADKRIRSDAPSVAYPAALSVRRPVAAK